MTFDGHAYLIVSGEYDFATARTKARQMTYKGLPGHLATITSSGEYNFLRWTMNAQHTWIALSDADSEGNWIFVDGPENGRKATASAFLLWVLDEPDTNGDNDDCAAIFFYGYGAFSCASEFNYVVEFECVAEDMPGRCNSKHL
jgi:hypothetical protein